MIKKKQILLKFLVFLFLVNQFFCKKELLLPPIEDGILDLRNLSFENSPSMELKGEWKFLYNELIPYSEIPFELERFKITKIPHRFSDVKFKERELSNIGVATYYLKILIADSTQKLGLTFGIVNTAYKLFINGEEVLNKGEVGKTEETSKPKYFPTTIDLKPGLKEIEILLHVSNFHNRFGGLRNAPRIALYSQIKKERELGISSDLLVFGALLITSIYQFTLYLLRRKDRSTLYFGLFAFIYTVKTLFENQRIFLVLFPDFPWEYDIKISYIVTFLSPYLFTGFMATVFSGIVPKYFYRVTASVSGILCSIVIFTPAIVYTKLAFYNQVYIIFIGVFGLWYLIKALRENREGSLVFLLGYIVYFLLAGVNDTLYSLGVINSIYLSSYALMLFVIALGIVISIRFSTSFSKVEDLSSEIQETVVSYEKFVPKEFLSYLNKKDIRKIEVGRQTLKELTILFSDIRDFTVLSEKMNPQENFNFVNSYLARMNPIIQKHNGFIDKFIGDAIMAIYPKADDALRSALEMIDEIENYNFQREKFNYSPLKIGIGLNTGKVMMGIVGDSERMSTTVIGDSVNLAARIESLTKEYKSSILLSDFTVKALEPDHKFEVREIDTLNVKGKSIPVALFECFNDDSLTIRKAKRQTNDLIMLGLSFKNAGEYSLAIEKFEETLKINPEDKVAKIQIEKCLNAMNSNN